MTFYFSLLIHINIDLNKINDVDPKKDPKIILLSIIVIVVGIIIGIMVLLLKMFD